MPHSLKARLGNLRYKKIISDKDYDRLCKALEQESHKIDKVYVVTAGEYSDYGISAVFIDKKSAEMYCATKNTKQNLWDEYRVEEYTIGIIEGDKDYKKLVKASINKTTGKIEISWLWSYEDMIPEVVEDRFHTEYKVSFTAKRDATDAEIEKIARDMVAKWKYDGIITSRLWW